MLPQALFDRARPSAVRGPVLAHRASDTCRRPSQGTCRECPGRVLARHLGAESGLPGGFPFFNQPLRGVCVLINWISMIFLRCNLGLLVADGTDDGLSSIVDNMHVLDVHLILTPCTGDDPRSPSM